ncbi:MAG: dockerin type I repeat-containing protein [Oscillospiraceae bacterium]|nr:dockerin type I repeat-containing protein [Oscillospiraceae bacterium]
MDFPTEVPEGTNYNDWMKDAHIYTNGYNDGITYSVYPIYNEEARSITDSYGCNDNAGEGERIRSFIKGLQTGVGAYIRIPEELRALGDVFAKDVKLYVNGKESGSLDVYHSGMISALAPDTLTVTDGKTVPGMPAYQMLPVSAVSDETIYLEALLVSDDPNVKVRIDESTFTDEFKSCFAYDTYAGTVTPHFEGKESDSFTLYYTVTYDADGNGADRIVENFVDGESYTVRTVSADSAKISSNENSVYVCVKDADGNEINGIQISQDGEHFISDARITGLTPDTEYNLYYRQGMSGKSYIRTFRTSGQNYGVFVGRTPVTDSNLGELNYDGWHYDPETKTLTLKDCTLKDYGTLAYTEWQNTYARNQYAVIVSKDELTVNLIGENHLELTPRSGSVLPVIYSEKDVTLTGNGSLTFGKQTTTTTTTTSAATTTAPVTSDSLTDTSETTTATGTTAPTEPDYLLGDINDDGSVSVEDAQLALLEYVNAMTGLESHLAEKQKLAGDINGDNEISVEDAQNILLYYVSNTLSGQNIKWDELLGKSKPSEPMPFLLKLKAFFTDDSTEDET